MIKKQIKSILISRDTDEEILVQVYRTSHNGVDLLLSTNQIDAVTETVDEILSEAGQSKYRLVQTPLPKLIQTTKNDGRGKTLRWIANYWKTLKQQGLTEKQFIIKFDKYIKGVSI